MKENPNNERKRRETSQEESKTDDNDAEGKNLDAKNVNDGVEIDILDQVGDVNKEEWKRGSHKTGGGYDNREQSSSIRSVRLYYNILQILANNCKSFATFSQQRSPTDGALGFNVGPH